MTPSDAAGGARLTGPITSVEELHQALQEAMEVELSTLPPYLTALWSIRRGTNDVATRVVASVAMEEMLHMALVANVMNALDPVLGPPVLPGNGALSFPHELPYSDGHVQLTLGRLDQDAIQAFMDVECPEARGARPQPDRFTTIGQFYDAIIEGIDRLEAEGQQVFHPDRGRQIPPDGHYYGGGGDLIVVEDAESARAALREICTQGEGRAGTIDDGDAVSFGERAEIAHFYRFQELQIGRAYRSGDEPGAPTGERVFLDDEQIEPIDAARCAPGRDLPVGVRAAIDDFDVTYRALLQSLEQFFAGRFEHPNPMVPIMYELEEKGRSIMRMPVGGGAHACPLWRATAGA